MEFPAIRTSVAVFAMAAFIGLSTGPAQAQTLIESLESLLQKHKRLMAAVSDADAAREQVKVSWGGWYPNASIDATKGYERQNKGNGARNTSLPAQNLSMTVTQRLVDFGSTNATIDRAQLNFQQKQADLVSTRQQLMFEGVAAYLEVMRAARIYKFAQSSEANIKRQTELEDARVLRGSGFSTDVLQAKTQLAGAQARRTRAQGTLRNAQNRFLAVFYNSVTNPDAMLQPRTPLDMVPTSLDSAIEIAQKNKGLTQITEFWGYYGTYAQEPT